MKNCKPAGDRKIDFDSLSNRRSMLRMISLGIILIGFALAGCDTRSVDASAGTNSKKENKMESIQATTTTQPKLPPIDAAVVTETETATFAMG